MEIRWIHWNCDYNEVAIKGADQFRINHFHLMIVAGISPDPERKTEMMNEQRNGFPEDFPLTDNSQLRHLLCFFLKSGKRSTPAITAEPVIFPLLCGNEDPGNSHWGDAFYVFINSAIIIRFVKDFCSRNCWEPLSRVLYLSRVE